MSELPKFAIGKAPVLTDAALDEMAEITTKDIDEAVAA
jgi:hypothetical protein